MPDKTLDPSVLAALPSGCEVLDVEKWGTTGWSNGFRVKIRVDGRAREYFLKIIQRPNHAEMARGEYESQKALAERIPDNAVVPLAHGTFDLDPSKSFFLTRFLQLDGGNPSPDELADVLQALHSSPTSPTGKYGFHVQTFNGIVPLINDWCDTWEAWFSRQLRSDIAWEQSVAGPDADFDKVADEFFAKVVPRLLRPLETGGRSIKPTLVHGDLWHGNCQVDSMTGKLILFDSCCCYAHHELELFMMRDQRYRFSGGYKEACLELVGASEPVEDFDDRHALYAIRDKIINSGLYEDRRHFRDEVKEEMLRLLEKHPLGLAGLSS